MHYATVRVGDSIPEFSAAALSRWSAINSGMLQRCAADDRVGRERDVSTSEL
jgi:hypothetical protein